MSYAAELLSYTQVLLAISEGKKIRKTHWPSGGYVFLKHGLLMDEKNELYGLVNLNYFTLYIEEVQGELTFQEALLTLIKGECKYITNNKSRYRIGEYEGCRDIFLVTENGFAMGMFSPSVEDLTKNNWRCES